MHTVTDAVDEKCSALQVYLFYWWSTRPWVLCSVVSAPDVHVLSLLLVVQLVMHIFWGFPRSEWARLPALDAMLPQDVTARRDALVPQLPLCLPYTWCSQGLPKVYVSMHVSSKSVHHWPLGRGGWDREGEDRARLPRVEDHEVCLGTWFCALSTESWCNVLKIFVI